MTITLYIDVTIMISIFIPEALDVSSLLGVGSRYWNRCIPNKNYLLIIDSLCVRISHSMVLCLSPALSNCHHVMRYSWPFSLFISNNLHRFYNDFCQHRQGSTPKTQTREFDVCVNGLNTWFQTWFPLQGSISDGLSLHTFCVGDISSPQKRMDPLIWVCGSLHSDC